MRGQKKQQETLFSLRTPGDRVPKDHPLRRVKDMADAALAALSPTFDRMYSGRGRPSIPPEQLLKALLLMALYSPCDAVWDERMCSLGTPSAGTDHVFCGTPFPPSSDVAYWEVCVMYAAGAEFSRGAAADNRNRYCYFSVRVAGWGLRLGAIPPWLESKPSTWNIRLE